MNVVGERDCNLVVRRAGVSGAPPFFVPTMAAISEDTCTVLCERPRFWVFEPQGLVSGRMSVVCSPPLLTLKAAASGEP